MPTGHIGLNVSDLDRATQFYTQIFGFSVLHKSEADGRKFALLGQQEQLSLTLWQQSAGRADHRLPGLHHLSFQAESVEQVRNAERLLKALGVRFHHHGIVAHGEGADSGGIYFEDPDGIRLEIFSPNGVKEVKTPATNGPACGFF